KPAMPRPTPILSPVQDRAGSAPGPANNPVRSNRGLRWKRRSKPTRRGSATRAPILHGERSASIPDLEPRPAEDGRLYPTRPILAVSVAVFRAGLALVGRRAREPMIGRFSLPGGVVEIGETLAQAVARELYEEVGVEAEIVAFNRHVEPIVRDGERVRAHFVIA